MKVNIRIVPLSKVGAASVETPHWQFWWTRIGEANISNQTSHDIIMSLSGLYDGFVICSYLVVFLAQQQQFWSCSADSPPSRLSRRRCTGPCPPAGAGWGSGTTRPAPSLDPSDLITVRGSESQPTAQVTGQWRYDYNTRSMPFLTYISESGIHGDTKDIATRSERHYGLFLINDNDNDPSPLPSLQL